MIPPSMVGGWNMKNRFCLTLRTLKNENSYKSNDRKCVK